MRGRVVDYRVVKLTKPSQYAVYFFLEGGGRTGQTRLKTAAGERIVPTPTVKSWEDEPDEIQIQIRRAAIKMLQDRLENDELFPQKNKYKTCREAMEAYQKWHGENKKTDPNKFRGTAKYFTEHFGDNRLININPKTARQFCETLISKGYSYDTVRLALMTASGLITWLTKKNQWYSRNPFQNLISEYKNKFPARLPAKCYISDHDYKTILEAARGKEYRIARVYIQVARYTGIRPDEIYRLDTTRIDREKLAWEFLVTKTEGNPYYRTIGIPRLLIEFIDSEAITGDLPISESSVGRQMRELREKTGITKITPKTFRKDYSNRMEEAGATEEIVDLHQGRGLDKVVNKHYLTHPMRAVIQCRPYINAMFGEREKTMRRVV